jgi:hypothetical protein
MSDGFPVSALNQYVVRPRGGAWEVRQGELTVALARSRREAIDVARALAHLMDWCEIVVLGERGDVEAREVLGGPRGR